MSRRSRAPKPTLGMTGPKLHRTSLDVALAAQKSPKPTFKETAASAAAKSWLSDRYSGDRNGAATFLGRHGLGAKAAARSPRAPGL